MPASDPIFDMPAAAPGASDMELVMKGYGLTLARFFYRMPDYPSVIGEFIWQFHDLAPDYPALFEKIDWWRGNIDGLLHSVAFDHRRLVSGGEWRRMTGEFALH